MAVAPRRTPLSPYQRRLLLFLSVATFFEGYDFLALGQILPNLRADMGLSEAEGGRLVAVIGIGTILAYGVVRLADRFGRRAVLTTTILGYTLFTFATAFARSAYDFALYQLVARVFLIGELSLSMVYAAEDFPADGRGHAIGVIQAASALGGITCAASAPALLATSWGWRAVYLVGVVPLLLLAYARRGLRESERFADYAAGGVGRRSLGTILRSPHRRRIYQLAVIWGLLFACAQNAVFFWKEFAVTERGFTDGQVGFAVAVAALASLAPLFLVGRLLDAWGRRPAATVIFLGLAASVVAAYQLHALWLLTPALTVALFSVSAAFAVLNSFTTELFPTDCRAEAFAWANNLLGRSAYVVGPAVVGAAAGTIGWGNAVSLTALCPLGALALILWLLPETKGRELEETAHWSRPGIRFLRRPTMARTGRCYCGVVRYELEGALGPLVNCHCRYCRRAHGAAFATVALVRSDDLRVISGEEAVQEYRSPAGARCFCGRCGGRLFNRPRSSPTHLALVIASLEEEPTDRPVMHVNVESKAAWYDILDDLPQYAALPRGG